MTQFSKTSEKTIKKIDRLPFILAIDTSCDDTAAAVCLGTKVLSNVIASQTQLHQPYGGVFPTIAKQAHQENIDQTIKIALQRAKLSWQDIKAIAVTIGPGLAPALEIGITKAKILSQTHQLPIIAINHIEGHALSILAQRSLRQPKKKQPAKNDCINFDNNFTKNFSNSPQHQFPALALVVSGGHTEFIKITQIGAYQRLGYTVDDAAGEVLDKVGRMLNLGYPAGPIIEKFALKSLLNSQHFNTEIPLPMTGREDFNMSFSGLKTWARNKIEALTSKQQLDKQAIYDFSALLQYGVFRHICYKLNKLLLKHKIKEVWLGGGVAANLTLRRMIREILKAYNNQAYPPSRRPKNRQSTTSFSNSNIHLFTPYSKRLCMDNAAMIAVVAGYQYQQHQFVKQLKNLERKPRLQIDQ